MVQHPKIAFIGNLAIDNNHYVLRSDSETHFGGACLYSAISGGLFYPVYLLSKTGYDYDYSLYQHNPNNDFTYVTKIEGIKTNIFNNYIYTSDGSDRRVIGDVPDQFALSLSDLPPVIYESISHIHFTTNEPSRIVDIIEYLRKHTPHITISIDTIEDFANSKLTTYLYDIVDVAIIDDTNEELLRCKAQTKIIKHGKYGCTYSDRMKEIHIYSEIINEVIDPIGAGDCLNGVLMTLLANGISPEKALYVANRVATEFVKNYGLFHLTRKKEFIDENKKYLGRTPK